MLNDIDKSWWYWLLTSVLLGWGVITGSEEAFRFVIGLSLIQVMHYWLEERSARAFPVQVRFATLVIVSALYWEPLRLLYWIPFIGVTANVAAGYCFMARVLSLLPGNRKAPLTRALIKETIFSKPVRGNVLQGLPRME